ncbi:hypothetical protein C8J55DRAFT_489732 [Lentinula edodes]|uniref:Uncharacterized protein n=1 Tax=Lentinula lateritia TaxID=40482 RepID=A0A9W9A9L3_9AGAR|nr:hypothetical protein C8J55DRAFT_489732 [Lentinula edodes]
MSFHFSPTTGGLGPITTATTPRLASQPILQRVENHPPGMTGITPRPSRELSTTPLRPWTPSIGAPIERQGSNAGSFTAHSAFPQVQDLPAPGRGQIFAGSIPDDVDGLNQPDNHSPLPALNRSNAPVFASCMRANPRPEHETTALMTWVDEIRPQFTLEPRQVRELKGMVMVAPSVETEPLKLHLLTHAAICRLENKSNANSDTASVKEVVDSAMKQLSKHIEIPSTSKEIIRTLGRDECANPARSSYGDVGKAVWARCKAEADVHDFSVFLSKTTHETAFKKVAEATGKKMLQQFRDDILATIVVDESGRKEPLNLEKATHILCKKYVKGGGGGTLHQFRFAMIRRFMRESECEEEGPVLKRRKIGNGGRQTQDEAFWGRFDKYLKEKIDEFGMNMKDDKWKEYLTETVQADWQRFGEPNNSLLPALPLVSNSNGFTAVRVPLQDIHDTSNSGGSGIAQTAGETPIGQQSDYDHF